MWNFRGGRERRRRSNQCFFRPSRSNREYSLVSRRSGGRAWKKNYCSREISLSVARAKDAGGSFGQKGNQRRNYSHPNHERSRIVPLNRVTNYYGTSRLQSDQRPLNIILLDAGSGDLKRTVHESRERDRPDILIRFKPRLPNKGSTARTNPSHPSELWTAGARNYFHGCTLRTDHRYLLPRTCPLRSTESQPDREAKFFFSKEPKGRKFLYEFEQRVY